MVNDKPGVRFGSTRVMAPVEPGVISFEYTDRWSAFDRGLSDQSIPGIGAARCACAVMSFELAHEQRLPTHFLRQVSEKKIYVDEFSVPGKQTLSKRARGHVLPLEWIWRTQVFGSLLERIREKKIDPVALGFEKGAVVLEGMHLPKMFLECTTKFEPTDRHLSDKEAQDLASLTKEEWGMARFLIRQAVGASIKQYKKAGFSCPDGKLELAKKTDGRIVIADVFGTPDENRIIEDETGDVYSKDIIRSYLKTTPWKAELDKAKKAYPNNKFRWPEYPTLPDALVCLVSVRYEEVAQRYAGVLVS